jgi:hypothetical protein
MKRKLIDFDVFKKIESESLSRAELELTEAEDVLAHVFERDGVSLYCLGEDTVLYETLDGTYIHATYQVDRNSVTLENVEELVVNEDQEKVSARQTISNMVEELLEGNELKANDLFEEYLGMPVTRRVFLEGTDKPFRLVPVAGTGGKVKGYKKGRKKVAGPERKQKRSVVASRMRSKHKHSLTMPDSEKKRRKRLRDQAKRKYGLMKEQLEVASVVSENVLGYIEYRELGPVLNEAVVQRDERGNIIAVRIPTTTARNEGRILSFNWKTLNTDVKVMREEAKALNQDLDFAKAIINLKRQNAFSDSEALEEALEVIATNWPQVLYLTQEELAHILGQTLHSLGETNYDDEVCNFMAEGILRTAQSSCEECVAKVLKAANAPKLENEEDAYAAFQNIVQEFYPSLDESTAVEMQVFFDLYNTTRDIHEHAVKTGDEMLRDEAEDFLKDLFAVCEGDVGPDLELAGVVAEWLQDLVETNLETAPWNPTNATHTTVSGDHPRMAQIARHTYAPSSDFDGSGGGLQVSDGKSYKGGLEDEMRNRSWGQSGGDGVYPSLKNPYVPKPFGDYTMKGEPGVDKNSGSGVAQWQSGETWPSLQNPNVPKAETPQTYKMNHGKEQDLVVDK